MPINSQWKSEAEFQSACFKWFDKTYPELRGRLIGIFNNPKNASQLISMGLRPGIADMLFFPDDGSVVWIELKIGYNKQSDNQISFEHRVTSFGHKYFVVSESLDIFQNLIKTYIYGRSTRR